MTKKENDAWDKQIEADAKSGKLMQIYKKLNAQDPPKNPHAVGLGRKGGSSKSPAKAAAAAANLAKNRNPGRKPKLQGLVQALGEYIKILEKMVSESDFRMAPLYVARLIIAHEKLKLKTTPQTQAVATNADQVASLEHEKLGRAE